MVTTLENLTTSVCADAATRWVTEPQIKSPGLRKEDRGWYEPHPDEGGK